MKYPIPQNMPNPDTLTPWDYDSFAMVILSQNHKEINITVSSDMYKSHNYLTIGFY